MFATRLDSMIPGPLAIRRHLRGPRRRGAALIVASVLGGAVVAHHAMPMEMHAMPVAAICVALAIGALSAAGAAGAFRFVRRRSTRALGLTPSSDAFSLPVGIPARASPLFLQICSIRR
jgi:hypothetical protein